ncbi:hypothetical protein CJ030_MR8G028331 [Morella rubra]|uniref:Uncharacterized protein n=1 Tax=Morella rubra TaxID=262757 RepID=A0A6A1UUL6_9ROSI|nr:hypothetical protein CJ030_MR8G028331 [Morella rubra]
MRRVLNFKSNQSHKSQFLLLKWIKCPELTPFPSREPSFAGRLGSYAVGWTTKSPSIGCNLPDYQRKRIFQLSKGSPAKNPSS